MSCIVASGSERSLLSFVMFSGNCGRSSITVENSSEMISKLFCKSLLIGRIILVIVSSFSHTDWKLSTVIPIFSSMRMIITSPSPAPSVSSKTVESASSIELNFCACSILFWIRSVSNWVSFALLRTSILIVLFFAWRINFTKSPASFCFFR